MTEQRLTADGRLVAPLEIAENRRSRSRGLLGRSGIDGALLLRPAGSIHTFGMRFAIDAAFCDSHLRVVLVKTLPPWRITLPRPRRVKAVLEAEAGAFAGWGIVPGTQLEIEEAPR